MLLFYFLILNLLEIKLYILILFAFYKYIFVSWPQSRITQVFKLFFIDLFFNFIV
jgi:hypothetical protein